MELQCNSWDIRLYCATVILKELRRRAKFPGLAKLAQMRKFFQARKNILHCLQVMFTFSDSDKLQRADVFEIEG